jgi:sporulation protein YlmC with PRC-barrel domain
MSTESTATLVKLGDTGQTVADPADDIRGRKVFDRQGEELGEVDDLLIDTQERKVRLLRVEHGGILGFGATASFVPVEAIARITDEVVHISESRERVSGAPRYDPDVVDAANLSGSLYDYYGYPPLWGPAYVPRSGLR